MVVRDTPILIVDFAYEQQPSVPDDVSTVSAQAAIAQAVAAVAAGPHEVEKAPTRFIFMPPMHPPLLSQRYVVS
jgi:hypothetical protein